MENYNSSTQAKARRKPETVKRQILTNVRKGLSDLAAKKAKESGKYEAPTDAEVKVECQKRWQQHLDRFKEKEDVSVYFD